ncbi:MAG: hypothetical protein A3I05_02370 [Deltaproteobacteria bacterium RIFCSPLOWO2_02_FULL_44_10]|nr:MAG: hypothetical protein A3I05_02370 [Deltaproteobacteria bacterium RIFCSPLOWO2_02_FULL_44_10]
MVDVDDIRRKLHEMSSAITVVESFILRFDSTHVEDEMLRELHEASLTGIEQIKIGFEAAHDAVDAITGK